MMFHSIRTNAKIVKFLKALLVIFSLSVIFLILSFFRYLYETHQRDQRMEQLLSLSYVKLSEDGSIFIHGKLTPTLLDDFKKLTAGMDLHGKRIIIRSLGGNLLIGIELGNMIFDNQMDIEIDGICMSACANYLFTAANNKVLSEKSGLIFHGGMTQKNLAEKYINPDLWGPDDTEASVHADLTPAEISELRKVIIDHDALKNLYASELHTETQFFNKIGVNQLITVYGQLGPYEEKYKSRNSIGFIYDIADLNKLGVSNISVKDGKRWRGYKNLYFRNVYWAKVIDLPVAISKNN